MLWLIGSQLKAHSSHHASFVPSYAFVLVDVCTNESFRQMSFVSKQGRGGRCTVCSCVEGLGKARRTATFRSLHVSRAWARGEIDKHRSVFEVAAVYHAEKESCRSREELRRNGSRY